MMLHSPERRHALARTLRYGAALAGGICTHGAWAQAGPSLLPYNKAAFEARSLADVLKALGAPAAQESKDIELDAPELSENGASVPVAVSTRLPGVQRLLLVVPKNPNALAALFDLGDGVLPQLGLRLKMNQTTDVLALALLADGRALYARREVRVTIGGCGATVEGLVLVRPPEASKIRVQAASAGAASTLRVLLAHEMESGQRKDASGKTVPPWHIRQLSVLHKGRVVINAQWGPAVARNPLLQLALQGAKAGDTVGVRWHDTRGESRFDEALVG